MPHLSLLVRAAIALILLAATPSANAEETRACAERARVVQKLQEKFGETLRSLGLHRERVNEPATKDKRQSPETARRGPWRGKMASRIPAAF